MGLDQVITAYDDDGDIITKDYRKENWLRNWMIEHTELDYDSDTEEVELSREQIKDLVDSCKYVLSHKDKAEEELPTLGGFFFGTTEYDDWYFEGVRQVKNDMEELLENDEITYFKYWDWW